MQSQSATPAQRKTLLRLLESRDPGAQAQGRALMKTLADPALYDAALGAVALSEPRNWVRHVEYIEDKTYVRPERRPFRDESWGPGWHWPPGAPALQSDRRDADDDVFATLAEAPAETPVVRRLAEGVTALSIALHPRYRAPSHFEPSFLAPFTSLRALSLSTHRPWPVTRARLRALFSAAPALRTLSLVNVELPDGLDAFEAAPELEVLELSSPTLASLGSLPKLPRLHTLLLNSAKALAALGAPGRFPSLARFVVVNAGALTDLAALEGCSALESVRLLYAHQLTDLAPLRASHALTALTLHSVRGLASLEPLSAMRSLAHLDVVAPGALTTLAPVPFDALEVLSVERAEALTTLGPVRALPRLTTASLLHCPALEDVRALAQAPALETLALAGARALVSVDSLAGLPVLHRVDLRNTGVSTAEPFSTLPALRAAALGESPLTPAQLSPRARVAASFHPDADLDLLDARTPAQLDRLVRLGG